MDWLEELQKKEKNVDTSDLNRMFDNDAYMTEEKRKREEQERLKAEQQLRDIYLKSKQRIDTIYTKIMEYAVKANEIGKFGIVAEDKGATLTLRLKDRRLELIPCKQGLLARTIANNNSYEYTFPLNKIDGKIISGFVQWVATGSGFTIGDEY